jgi:hypothetical protein
VYCAFASWIHGCRVKSLANYVYYKTQYGAEGDGLK